MNRLSGFVSLHPYFKVPPDKMPHLKAILPEFAAKTRNETGNLFYEFTINGDEVFCREAYVNAEALLAHLDNVSAMLAQALTMAELVRIEVHGPAAELDETERAAGPSETRLVRIAQLIAMVAPIILKHRFGVHRGDCARAARARTQMFRRSLQSSTASLTEIRLRLRPGQTR